MIFASDSPVQNSLASSIKWNENEHLADMFSIIRWVHTYTKLKYKTQSGGVHICWITFLSRAAKKKKIKNPFYRKQLEIEIPENQIINGRKF